MRLHTVTSQLSEINLVCSNLTWARAHRFELGRWNFLDIKEARCFVVLYLSRIWSVLMLSATLILLPRCRSWFFLLSSTWMVVDYSFWVAILVYKSKGERCNRVKSLRSSRFIWGDGFMRFRWRGSSPFSAKNVCNMRRFWCGIMGASSMRWLHTSFVRIRLAQLRFSLLHMMLHCLLALKATRRVDWIRLSAMLGRYLRVSVIGLLCSSQNFPALRLTAVVWSPQEMLCLVLVTSLVILASFGCRG